MLTSNKQTNKQTNKPTYRPVKRAQLQLLLLKQDSGGPEHKTEWKTAKTEWNLYKLPARVIRKWKTSVRRISLSSFPIFSTFFLLTFSTLLINLLINKNRKLRRDKKKRKKEKSSPFPVVAFLFANLTYVASAGVFEWVGGRVWEWQWQWALH